MKKILNKIYRFFFRKKMLHGKEHILTQSQLDNIGLSSPMFDNKDSKELTPYQTRVGKMWITNYK